MLLLLHASRPAAAMWFADIMYLHTLKSRSVTAGCAFTLTVMLSVTGKIDEDGG